MQANPIDLTLVIPCYRDAGHLARNVQMIVDYLVLSKLSYEFIFVDDASPDDTGAQLRFVAQQLNTQNIPNQIVTHARNMGRGRAVRSGIGVARGRVVGYLDIDLENLFDSLLLIYQRLNAGTVDMIIGRRMTYESTLFRMALSFGYRLLRQSLLKLPFPDTEAGYKFWRADCAKILVERTTYDGWFWDTEVIWWALRLGYRVSDHPIIFVRDPNKKSTVHPLRDTWNYLLALRSFRQQTTKLIK